YKLAADRLGSGFVHFAVKGNNAAKGRSWVGLEGFAVRLLGSFAQRHAARVGVLDDDASAGIKAAHTLPSCIGVCNIVVRQLFTLQLLVAAQQTVANGAVCVKGSALVRVFAVTQG